MKIACLNATICNLTLAKIIRQQYSHCKVQILERVNSQTTVPPFTMGVPQSIINYLQNTLHVPVQHKQMNYMQFCNEKFELLSESPIANHSIVAMQALVEALQMDAPMQYYEHDLHDVHFNATTQRVECHTSNHQTLLDSDLLLVDHHPNGNDKWEHVLPISNAIHPHAPSITIYTGISHKHMIDNHTLVHMYARNGWLAGYFAWAPHRTMFYICDPTAQTVHKQDVHNYLDYALIPFKEGPMRHIVEQCEHVHVQEHAVYKHTRPHWSSKQNHHTMLIGNAIHPLVPLSESSLTLDVVDAMTMAQCLAQQHSIKAAVQQFEHVRRAAVERSMRKSARFVQLEMSKHHTEQWLRNMVTKLLCKSTLMHKLSKYAKM